MKIIKPKIFPTNIISGVTEKNLELYPNIGFSIYQTKSTSEDYIDKCKNDLAKLIRISPNQIIKQKQIHSDKISIVNELSDYYQADAMITNKKRLCLSISIADCIAILIYDPENKVIAGIHSGWRGTQLNITGKTIEKMQDEFNSKPENMIVYISPSASKDNYQVGEEFTKIFPKYTSLKNDKYYFDNNTAVLDQILSKKINPSQIEVSILDTISNTNLHSFRRDKEKSARMSAFIMLNE